MSDTENTRTIQVTKQKCQALQQKSLVVASHYMKQNVFRLLAHLNTQGSKVLPFQQFSPFTLKYYTTFIRTSMFIFRTDLKLVKTKATLSIGESNENNILSYKLFVNSKLQLTA